MIDAVVKSKESTFLGYSETIGEALMKAPGLTLSRAEVNNCVGRPVFEKL